MTHACSPRLVLDARNGSGESPIWSQREQALYWIDVQKHLLERLHPATGRVQRWKMPAQIGAHALCASGAALVALRTGLFKLDLEAGGTELVAAPPFNARTHRFNEGKCDAAGQFWVGVAYKPLQGASASAQDQPQPLYRYGAGQGLVTMPVRASIANGLAWAPDNRRCYFTDSAERTVRRFDFDLARGTLAGAQVFKHFQADSDMPDGAAMDQEGGYWCALYGGSRIVRLGLDGAVSREIALPVSHPTMCTFGGPDLATLYITSASFGLSPQERQRQPHAGTLFSCRPGVRGLGAHLFAD